MGKKLTGKQAAFIEYYCRCWNGAEAARLAGYSEKSARQIGHENLKKPHIREAIDEKLEELKMGTDETLVRLAEQARGSISDFVDINQFGMPNVDLQRAAAMGKLHLIKKFKFDKDGRLEFELHDSQAALVQLARIHGLYKDENMVRLPDEVMRLVTTLGISLDEMILTLGRVLKKKAEAS